jgi:hypothetical protein
VPAGRAQRLPASAASACAWGRWGSPGTAAWTGHRRHDSQRYPLQAGGLCLATTPPPPAAAVTAPLSCELRSAARVAGPRHSRMSRLLPGFVAPLGCSKAGRGSKCRRGCGSTGNLQGFMAMYKARRMIRVAVQSPDDRQKASPNLLPQSRFRSPPVDARASAHSFSIRIRFAPPAPVHPATRFVQPNSSPPCVPLARRSHAPARRDTLLEVICWFPGTCSRCEQGQQRNNVEKEQPAPEGPQ